jgi:pimeloyl-ACP methyl ester carboxylesterase
MAPRAKLDPLVIAGREAMAFARQAWLLRHDTRGGAVPSAVDHGDDVVVFLHGLFASAGVLRPLRAAVTRHRGVHAAALSYPPGPGIEELSERLRALLDTLPATARIHLVGHSLGGLVVRHFVQEIGDARVVQTISLATPFAGVPRAAWLGLHSARDLSHGSPILRRIALHPDAAAIPHLSIIAGADTLVDAPVAHALPGGDVQIMDARGHNGLLFDPDVARAVAQRVLSRRGA